MRKRGVDGFRVLQSEKKEKYQTIMLQITLDMYQTLAAAVVVLALGRFLRGRVRLLERFCIPAPVIGGVLFAIFTCVCYGTGIAEFAFDDILKEVCMVFFFTSVGFQANLKVLRSGGTAMIVFLVLIIGLIVGQNFVAIGLSKVLGISPLVGLCTGSIPMVGGHGTAGAFGPMLEGFGVRGATTLCTAAATYGLIAGSMMGGPVGKTLIEKHDLLKTVVPEDDSLLVEDEIKHERHASMYPRATFQIIIAMGIGTIVSKLLSLTGMTFPVYIGAMIAAACIRNIGEYSGAYVVYMGEINDIGGISLSLFLGMAMITLKLLAAGRPGGPAGGAAGRADGVHPAVCGAGSLQRHGPRLRRRGTGVRYLRFRYGGYPQRHGQHAGGLREVRPLHQGVPYRPAGGQSVCGFFEQPGHHPVHQPDLSNAERRRSTQ